MIKEIKNNVIILLAVGIVFLLVDNLLSVIPALIIEIILFLIILKLFLNMFFIAKRFFSAVSVDELFDEYEE